MIFDGDRESLGAGVGRQPYVGAWVSVANGIDDQVVDGASTHDGVRVACAT